MKAKITLLALMLFSLNSFSQWQITNGPFGAGLISSLAIKDTTIFAGTVTGGVFVSTDKGINWTARNNGLTNLGNIISLVVNNTDVFAGVFQSGNNAVFSTNDNAANWTAKGLPFLYLFSLAVKPSFLIAGTWYGVSFSTNNGSSWSGSIAGLPSTASVSALAFEGTKIFCSVSGSSSGGTGVFLSNNNGVNWTSFNTGLTTTTITKLAVIGSNIFAGRDAGGLFISNTTTSGWTAIDAGLTNNVIKSLCVVGTNLFVGTSNGIFLTMNNGTTWTDVSVGLPANANIYSITSNDTDIYIGADTTVWRRSLAEMGVTGISESISKKDILKIYPNPFNYFTTIQFSSLMKNAEFVIYNVYGQLIKTINNISGDKIILYKESISSGLYFYEVKQDNGNIATGKLVITN